MYWAMPGWKNELLCPLQSDSKGSWMKNGFWKDQGRIKLLLLGLPCLRAGRIKPILSGVAT